MANSESAIDCVLGLEDARMTGAVTTLSGDSGGATRYGLASRWHPELVQSGFFEVGASGEPQMPNDKALPIARSVYQREYCSSLGVVDIQSQSVADYLLGFAVNGGIREAQLLLQRALFSLGKGGDVVDGLVSSRLVGDVNLCKPKSLLAELKAQEDTFYRDLAARRPQMQPLLHGLLDRADNLPPDDPAVASPAAQDVSAQAPLETAPVTAGQLMEPPAGEHDQSESPTAKGV